jgi:putative flippase GtrA
VKSELLTELLHHPLKTVNSHKELRYLVAGSASEAIEFVSFVVLLPLTHLLYVSNSVSFGFGVISGFIFHKTWTFRGEHQFKTRTQFLGYVGLALINFVLINLLVGYFVHGLKMNADVAKLISIVITVVWTYALTNFIIFRQPKKSEVPEVEA